MSAARMSALKQSIVYWGLTFTDCNLSHFCCNVGFESFTRYDWLESAVFDWARTPGQWWSQWPNWNGVWCPRNFSPTGVSLDIKSVERRRTTKPDGFAHVGLFTKFLFCGTSAGTAATHQWNWGATERGCYRTSLKMPRCIHVEASTHWVSPEDGCLFAPLV